MQRSSDWIDEVLEQEGLKVLKNTLNRIVQIPEGCPKGYIYHIEDSKSGKGYIGQCTVPVNTRFTHHCSGISPIDREIQKVGPEHFTVRQLFEAPAVLLCAYEAWFIKACNTLHPDGYNVQEHSRFHGDLSVAGLLLPTTTEVEVVPIKNDGVNSLVRVLLKQRGSTERIRIMFGQAGGVSFSDAIDEAMRFIKPFENENIPISIHPDIRGVPDELAKYYKELESYKGVAIDRLRLSVWDQKTRGFKLAILFVYLANKIKLRYAFGGKTIDIREAVATAKAFMKRLPTTEKTKIDIVASAKNVGVQQ